MPNKKTAAIIMNVIPKYGSSAKKHCIDKAIAINVPTQTMIWGKAFFFSENKLFLVMSFQIITGTPTTTIANKLNKTRNSKELNSSVMADFPSGYNTSSNQ